MIPHRYRLFSTIKMFIWNYGKLPVGYCLVPVCDLPGSLSVLVNSLFPLHSCVSGSGACHPLFSTLLSKPLVMAYLAPAVAACAHSRPPAQSLSCPIYLTQTRASQPVQPISVQAGWALASAPTSGHSSLAIQMNLGGIWCECPLSVCMSLIYVNNRNLQDSQINI